MGREKIGNFLRDDAAGVTVEFVAIAGFFFFLCFMVMEIALALYWWQTAEAAAQIGARYAVVYDPAVTGLSSTNSIGTTGTYGQSCDISKASSADPCSPFATITCTGGGTGCSAAAFNAVLAKIQTVFGAVQASNVTISYSYAGLGFVGGPIVPAVTVTISGVPFAFGDFLGGLLGTSPLTTVPTMSATFTGEDLSSSGAS